MWLTGTHGETLSLIQLPSLHLFSRAEDPAKQVDLPIKA